MNARFMEADAITTPVAINGSMVVERPVFWQRVHGLAGAIAVHPAQRWALVCEDSSWFAAGLFALAQARRGIVLPQAPQAGSLAASGAQIDAVFTDRPERFPDYAVLSVSDVALGGSTTPCLPDDDVLIESYTSGSSGAPKCVTKAFVQLRTEVAALEREWGARLGRDALVVATVPHYHLYGLLVRILWPLLAGRTFLTTTCLQPNELRACAATRDCIIVSSPAFLSRISDCSELPPAERVKAVFSSGAPLPDASAEMLQRDWGHAPIEIYGSTETGGIAWRAWSGAAERPLWRLINSVQIELREEAAGPRLWVKSGFTWQQDWMATGDLARLHDDGRFVLLGRADDVVKFEDKRVSLGEMRSRLITHAWVQDARLLLVPGRRTVIGAVVILSPQGRAAMDAYGRLSVRDTLRAQLRESYEAILVPRKWRFPESLPDNDMGKIELARLQHLFEKQS
ncbi:MAG TPA: class I adenylate-forming enzyme family protein [Gammaproteobacteria bacterium]|nr:class I adenylate-forming enzyme family protein [Gammaproteobacteria bacterium]